MRAEERSSKIRTLIVDDEPLARANISVLLRLDPAVEIVSECGSGAEALAEIRRAKPDLVFLDVQMPECDGFDVLEMLGKDLPPALVFVTAYDQHALRAFEAGALDYLLKPFDNARFALALGRARDRIANNRNLPRTERLAVKSAGRISFVKISEIDWIEAGLLRLPARGNENAFVAAQFIGTRGGTRINRLLPHPPLGHRESRSGRRPEAQR